MEKDKPIIEIPAEGNYIKILGNKIHGCESFESFLEELNNLKDVRKQLKKLEKENIRLKYQDIPYLEGTIKGYKARIEELEKENAIAKPVLKQNARLFEKVKELEINQCDHNISNECIRKSVIRDKIEELKNKYSQRMENKSSLYFTYSKEYGHIEVLKEILGE